MTTGRINQIATLRQRATAEEAAAASKEARSATRAGSLFFIRFAVTPRGDVSSRESSTRRPTPSCTGGSGQARPVKPLNATDSLFQTRYVSGSPRRNRQKPFTTRQPLGRLSSPSPGGGGGGRSFFLSFSCPPCTWHWLDQIF